MLPKCPSRGPVSTPIPVDWRRLLAPLACMVAVVAMRAETPAFPEWSVHSQSTLIEQWHGGLTSPYQGPYSLVAHREDKHTATVTLFLGRRLWAGGEIFYNPEVTQGTGLSATQGLGGFPNGEATRAGSKVPEYNTARLFIRQTFGLGGGREPAESGQNQIAGERDIERITLMFGKLSATDVFDVNDYSHDARTQFLNWALMANGAWDYPADVKGYTGGFTAEWNQASRALRWGVFMEPVAANERELDQHVRQANGQAFEWEERYKLGHRPGALRGLIYWNQAHMGSYATALRTPAPDIMLSRRYRSKVGAGLNWQQEIADDAGVFARVGVNDGRTETWAFTEIDRTVSAGASIKGSRWGRAADTVGVAALANGLSAEHRRYLAAGGYGFIVGDGRLSYRPEEILETYYNWKPAEWLALALDYQYARNPGYNHDRGPVSFFAVRGHVEF
jgi:high affinity Mn2+ porin